MTRRNLIYGLIAIVVLFVLGEFTLFFPSFSPTNEVVTYQVAWDSPQTEALFTQSCADCHSNETVWPWYSYVVPVAWLVNHDVHEGRDKFNISTGRMPELDELEENIMEGKMPPSNYFITHPDAALTDEEKTLLVDGLQASLSAAPLTGQTSGSGDSGGGDSDSDSDGN